MSAWLKWAGALALSASAAVGTQFQLAKVPPPVLDVNMLFVPPAELTKASASGFENLIADGLWLGLLQYYGDRLTIDFGKKVVNVVPMFELITDLDPQFWFAYWLGGWAIGDSGDTDAAVKLLAKGERLNPTDYNYPYIQGYIRFLMMKDYKGAAECFERASTYPDAPRFTRTLAARMYQNTGQDQLALQTWQSLYDHATDKSTRQIAKNNVERILAEMKGQRKRAFKVRKPQV